MNSQEKKIVVGGVVIAALSSAGFSMAQGDFNLIDDDYKSPTIISEKTLASNESTSINTPKTDVAIVDENNEEEEIEIKAESNEKVKSKVNTLNQTSKPQTNTSTLQNKKSENYWQDILSNLKSSGKMVLYSNLINTRAVQLDDLTVGIEFPNGLTPFGKTLLERPENKAELVKQISKRN